MSERMTNMTNWSDLITAEMACHGDNWDNVVQCTLTDEERSRMFDKGYGGVEGVAFACWTKTRVYFPCCYDGAEWVESVSRNPDGKPIGHFGGG